MKCPFGDGTTRCDSLLQDREIKAVIYSSYHYSIHIQTEEKVYFVQKNHNLNIFSS